MFQSTTPKEKIYIIPTRVGAYFIGSALIIILVGSGYSNNLVNLLGFFMLSFVFVSMVLTHLQLKGLRPENLEVSPAFSGEEISFSAVLQNETEVERAGIRVKSLEKEASNWRKPSSEVLARIRGKQGNRILWSEAPKRRGRFELKGIQLESVFPLGLFFTWKVENYSLHYYVYPKPEGTLPFPFPRAGTETRAGLGLGAGDEFKGHRTYQPGDSGHHIDWKAYARGRPLLIKEVNEGNTSEVHLDGNLLEKSGFALEARLSQLSLWVDQALRQNFSFSFSLGNDQIPAGSGILHARRCLEYLATYGKHS